MITESCYSKDKHHCPSGAERNERKMKRSEINKVRPCNQVQHPLSLKNGGKIEVYPRITSGGTACRGAGRIKESITQYRIKCKRDTSNPMRFDIEPYRPNQETYVIPTVHPHGFYLRRSCIGKITNLCRLIPSICTIAWAEKLWYHCIIPVEWALLH